MVPVPHLPCRTLSPALNPAALSEETDFEADAGAAKVGREVLVVTRDVGPEEAIADEPLRLSLLKQPGRTCTSAEITSTTGA